MIEAKKKEVDEHLEANDVIISQTDLDPFDDNHLKQIYVSVRPVLEFLDSFFLMPGKWKKALTKLKTMLDVRFGLT